MSTCGGECKPLWMRLPRGSLLNMYTHQTVDNGAVASARNLSLLVGQRQLALVKAKLIAELCREVRAEAHAHMLTCEEEMLAVLALWDATGKCLPHEWGADLRVDADGNILYAFTKRETLDDGRLVAETDLSIKRAVEVAVFQATQQDHALEERLNTLALTVQRTLLGALVHVHVAYMLQFCRGTDVARILAAWAEDVNEDTILQGCREGEDDQDEDEADANMRMTQPVAAKTKRPSPGV